jgi:class 3 adenylate cyclase
MKKESELPQVTTLSADISGFTAMSEKLREKRTVSICLYGINI